MSPINAASINFGGINASKLEFVDFSTPELKEYFENIQGDFEAFAGEKGNVTVRKFIQQNFSTNEVAYVNYVLDSARKFMLDNMDHTFLLELTSSLGLDEDNLVEEFDIGAFPLSVFISGILRKDKGIGGFEQLCQSRPTNIGNINMFLDKSSAGVYTFSKERYLLAFKTFFLEGEGVPFSKISGAKSYRDIFLKGRREGPEGSARNYYNFFAKNDSRNGDFPDETKDTMFHCVSNMVMMVYDLISLDIITRRTLVVPKNIPEKPPANEVAQTKAQFVFNLLVSQQLNVLFLTECLPAVFDDMMDDLSSQRYTIEYGIECDGLCNAIIYRLEDVSDLAPISVDSQIYPHQSEFKEMPLHLSNPSGNFHLISYHANGKGVTCERALEDTSFYSWLNALPGTVVLGGDLNMDFKKVGASLSEAFELGNPSAKGFSCYKQRSPLQAQYDKAGVFDTKFCDYIITKNMKRSGTMVVRTNEQGIVERIDGPGQCHYSPDSLVIPNNSFPFEHYIVMDRIEAEIIRFAFFAYISPSLSWLDDAINWLCGY